MTPRPVYCIIRDAHDDRSVADDVRKGIFTHAGITLDLGAEPDWLGADLPADDEWRIEWTKFYYGLDLAGAFVATGDVGYQQAWEDLVASWIRQVQVGFDESDVAARRMLNWTYAWTVFASSPAFAGLRPGLAEALTASIGEHAAYVRAELTPEVFRNHRTLQLYALFVVALAFPERDEESALLRFTVSELRRTLVEAFHPDGVHREASTHYQLVVLRSLVGMRENARRFRLDLPGDFDRLLERACEFAMHCHRPDGVVPALSDADNGTYPEVLSLAGRLLGRPDFTYAATGGEAGSPPARINASFADGGYYIQRSGWGGDGTRYRDERYLVFDCGPIGDGGHGHYDLLSVEIYAYGRPLVVDPGRFTYAEDDDESGPNPRHWFKGTAAHNTVCVDGLDQTPYRRGRPGAVTATGELLARATRSGHDVLEGRAVSPCYDAVHTRRIEFVANEYWIISDVLDAPTMHRYDLRWHLSAEAWQATQLATIGGAQVVHAPGLRLEFPSTVAVSVEPGWVAPRYGRKLPAPVVSVSTTGTAASFTTLVIPEPPSEGSEGRT